MRQTNHRIVAMLLPLLQFVFLFVALTDAFSISLQPPQSSSSSSSLSTTVTRYGYHHHNNSNNRFRSSVSSVLLASTSSSTSATTTTTTVCDKNKDESSSSSSSSSSNCLDKGLLLSSFNDGLKSNPYAINWLMNALVETLIKEEQQNTQLALEKSNVFSPCNGPDPVLLDQLEIIDRIVVGQGMIHDNDNNNDINNDNDEDEDDDNNSSNNNGLSWRKNLELLCQMKTSKPIDLRILYIPTAMYALRSDSTCTLGKQRGRNRADGKKRRTDMIRLLADQLDNDDNKNNNGNEDNELKGLQQQQVYNIRTITLDFDDGSVKQPELVTIGDASYSDDDGGGVSTTNNGVDFPKSGKEAIREWKPHLIYVQGGNTFWLHHCIEKGNWAQDLIDACSCNSNDGNNTTNNDVNSSPPSTSTFPAVYCGVSAGAILAGQSMQTACWKVRYRYAYTYTYAYTYRHI
jgi:hypothetical protein